VEEDQAAEEKRELTTVAERIHAKTRGREIEKA
jgi:hypothetical protein